MTSNAARPREAFVWIVGRRMGWTLIGALTH